MVHPARWVLVLPRTRDARRHVARPRADDDTITAYCKFRSAIFSMQSSVCNLQHAIFSIEFYCYHHQHTEDCRTAAQKTTSRKTQTIWYCVSTKYVQSFQHSIYLERLCVASFLSLSSWRSWYRPLSDCSAARGNTPLRILRKAADARRAPRGRGRTSSSSSCSPKSDQKL